MADTTTAGDIRSIIKNATQWWLPNKHLWWLGAKKWVTGKGDTIATKEEIATQKSDNSLNPKPTAQATSIWQRLASPTAQRTQAITKPWNILDRGETPNEVIAPTSQQDVGTFQNPMVQPIKNIKIEGLWNHNINLRKSIQPTKREENKNPLIETEGEKTKRMSDWVYSLYVDAYNKWQQGNTLTIEDVLGNKNYQRQFYGIDQKLLQDMVNDANLIAQADYDDQNALYLMDKYKNLWLSLDFEKLSHLNKWRVLDNMATNDAGWVRGMVDKITPFNLVERFGEKLIWEENKKAVADNIQWFRDFLEDKKIDTLTDEEVDKYVADDVAKLDKAYEKYYHNVYEQIFDDRKVWQQFYKDVAELQKKNKDITEEDAINEVMKNWTYNWVAYEKFPHTNTDQWRFWDDKDKEKEYNEKVKGLKDALKDEHDNKNAFFGNASVNNAIVKLAQIPLIAYDIAKNPWTFGKSLLWMGEWMIHKSIEWYADLLDTWIATTQDAIDVIKWDKDEFHINYKVGDVRDKMAKWKWYESFDEMLLKLGQLAQEDDTPWIKFVYNALNEMNNDRETAQAMVDYFDGMYGWAFEWNWDEVWHNIKEEPVEFVSDLSGFGELTAWLLGKWWLISPSKVQWLQNLFGAIDPYEVAINKANKLQYWPVLKAEIWLAKGGVKVAWAPFKYSKNVLETIVNKISGITAEERKILKENPELVEWYIKWTESRETLVDKIKAWFDRLLDEKTRIWQIYDQFKNSAQKIITDGIFDSVNEKLAEKWIYKVNGKLTFPEIWFTEKQQAQIVAAYNMLDKIKKWEASAADAWGVRRMIDSTLDWEWNTKQWLDLEAINLIKDIRRSIDDALKEQVPWFKDADASYAQISSDIKGIQKDWFNKDGTIKDNAYSRVGNLTNKANKAKLERLEKVMPWITSDLKALAVAESLDKAWKAMVGQYANQIWWVWAGIGAILWIATGWASVIPTVLAILWATMATPKNLAAVLKWQGKMEKPFKTIISKIENWIKLTGQEVQMLAKFLSENQEKLTQDAKYLYEKWLITDEEFKAIQAKKDVLKGEFKKIEKDYIDWKISKEEYKQLKEDFREAMLDIDYETAIMKARDKAWDEERLLTDKEKIDTGLRYGKRAKNVGFVTELEKDMTEESRRAWTEVRGYTDLKKKLVALSKNPTDVTAQHEFFHAVFSVVDPKTRKYLLDEAKKILGTKLGDGAAEEWLAESFGIYAKRWDINAWVLNKVKWGEGVLVNKLRNFFQKNYEWLQNYNGDRATINKMFDEILKDDLKLGENWTLDLSYLLKDSGDNGGVKMKGWLKPKPTKWWNGVRFKKDFWATKYKAGINWKSVDIDTKATSPDQLAKINSEWLSVMKSFISEKQAEKALDVSKDLLTKDGDAYLWTHTNKYDAQQFANFESAKDSHYKEFEWKEIAFLTNSEDMSKSYADQESKLANTKSFKNVEELNKYLKDNPTVIKDTWEDYNYTKKTYNTERIFDYDVAKLKWKDGKTYWWLYKTLTDKKIYPSLEVAWNIERNQPFFNTLGDMPASKEGAIKALKDKLWLVEINEWKDGKLEISSKYDREYVEWYDSEKQAIAEWFALTRGADKYHYQGIIQDMKNPLVVDIRNKYWTQTKRNELGLVKDIVDQKALWNIQSKSYKDAYYTSKVDDLRHELSHVDYRQTVEWWNDFLRDVLKYTAENDINALKDLIDNADFNIDDVFERVNGELDGLQTFREVAQNSIDLLEEYKNELKNANWDSYKPYLKEAGWDWLVSYMEHKLWIEKGTDLLLDQTQLRDAFYDYMQTNDYVFYALKNGWYDGVLFKNISDYGGKSKSSKWGDVLVAFNSKQFKAWDNANPTDSKYISYKKDTGLKSKLPDTDNDGRKLSEAQRKFFAWTKVVDKNGNLLRVYHGTRGWDFTVFRKWHSWSNNLAKVWYWFTPNKEWALKFAEWSWGWDAKPRAEEVYLDIKNPKIYEPSEFNLLKNEEKSAKIDEQRKVYNEKANKADWLDYTKAGWFFHDEFDHPYYERQIFQDLKRSWEYDRKYEWKYWKYDPEQYRNLAEEFNRNYDAKLDYDKILKDFEEYTKAKLDEEKEYSKLLDIKHNDPYDDFMYDIYKIDSNLDTKWTKDDLNMALNDYDSPNKFVEKLKSEWYDGIIIKWTEYDGEVIWWWARNDQYVAFDSNQIKRITNENPTKNDDIRFKKDMWLKAKDQTQTPEFKKWFKGSKVVNEDGTPKVVYHWSRHAWFTQFKPVNTMTDDLWFFSDKRKISSYFGGWSELWSDKWLTAEFNDAKKKWIDAVQKFAKEYLDLPHELEVTVNHITPKEAKEFGVEPWYVYMLDDWQIAGAIKRDGKHILKEKLSQEEIDKAIIDRIEGDVEFAEAWDRKNSRVYASYLDLKNPIIVDAKWVKFNQVVNPFNWKRWHIANIAYDAVDKWYDWAIIKNVSESPEYDLRWTVYIATKPNQIKSATDNIWTFDKNNPDIRYKKAYHWSPADFDRFDSSHMGEWEWAQLHWWGHYVASDKDVAKKYYAEMWALKYKDKQIWWYDNLISEIEDLPTDKKNMIQHIAYEVQKKGKTASEAKNDLINSYTKDIEQLKWFIDKNEKKLEQLKKAGKKSRVDYQWMINNAKRYIDRDNLLLTITKNLDENDFSKRNLYELEIPDPIKKDTPTWSNYWEERDSNYTKEQIEKIGKELAKKIEGKPLEEATMKDVENIAKAMHNKLSPASQKLFVESVKEWVDKWHDIKTAIEDNIAYYTSLSSTQDEWLKEAGLRPQWKYYDAMQLWRAGSEGRNIYNQISRILWGDKEASKFLESLGYDGIHYYWWRDGEAYVLFSDDAPQIQNHIRYKKDTNWLAKKSNWLQKKPSLTKSIRNLDATMKDGKYFDNLWKEIPKGAYYNINRYNKLLQKYQNAVKYKNYLAQYDLIEELNWLAHRIKKQTKNKSYEKNTYPMKNGFARKEMKRRWKDIIKWDAEEEMYYIVRPDWKKGVHVADSVWKWIPKI